MATRLALLLAALALAARAQDDAKAPALAEGEQAPASNPIGFQMLTGGKQFPIYDIPTRQPLKQLDTVRDLLELELVPNQIKGPGDNTTNPYVVFTARVYNSTLTPAVARVQQGSSLRVRMCNNLDASIESLLAPDFPWGVLNPPSMEGGNNGFRDSNTYAQHFHGLWGNPGTNNVPCDGPLQEGSLFCVRGDNVFADVLPGDCGEWQYDVALEHAPGNYWLHPHHHGSASNQIATASLPIVVEQSPSGFDYWSDASCAAQKAAYYGGAEEVIMHFQLIPLSINMPDGGTVGDYTGPSDDNLIITANGGIPADPYCCAGPQLLDGGASGGTWDNVGTENGSAAGLGTGVSLQPFYSSGPDGEFVLVNGGFQPVVTLQAGKLYLFRFVNAALMKWLDLSISGTACSVGIVGRDGIPLSVTPRVANHIALSSANRAEAFVVCSEAGNYTLRTGSGPFTIDPNCNGTHCALVIQPTLATLVVEAAPAGAASTTLADLGTCKTSYPSYLSSLLDAVPGNTIRTSLMNFTNPDTGGGYPSQGCAVNGVPYGESIPYQELLNVTQEFNLVWVSVHSFHHHISPYQLTSFDQPYGPVSDNGTWQIGDWGDTMMLTNVANGGAVRWNPGPIEVIGTGYTVFHCHLQPHTDEGCMMKVHIAQEKTIHMDKGLSPGGEAGVTLAAIFAFIVLILVPVLYFKRKRRLAAEAREAEHRAGLMHNA